MPQAIASRKDSPICEDVVRLKIHVRKPLITRMRVQFASFFRAAHAKSLGTRLGSH